MFIDKEVDKKVKYKLGIFDGSEPAEDDLEEISEISISNLNTKGEEIGTDISELVKLKNLQSLDLKGFCLTEEMMRVIGSFSKLTSLKLYSCKSKEVVNIDIETLKFLILDRCHSINLSHTKMPENVLIVDGGIVDLSRFQHYDHLRELGIKSSEIVNGYSLMEMKSLKSLNIDGSTIDDDDVLNKLKARKVAISNEFEYHPIK